MPADTDITTDAPPDLQGADTEVDADAGIDECDGSQMTDQSDQPDVERVSNPRDRWFRKIQWKRVLAHWLLPALAMLLAMAAGYLKWQDGSAHAAQLAAIQSVPAATESTIAMLSYRSDSVEHDLGAARDRMTGQFKDDYTSLTRDRVIPGAKQQNISAVATVPAAASVSATANRAVVLIFVNQTIIIGTDPPTSTASSVRVTLDKVGDRWLISQFEPV